MPSHSSGSSIPKREAAFRVSRFPQDAAAGRVGGVNQGEGGIPSAAAGGPAQPPPRVTLERAEGSRTTATLQTPGIGHVILAVEDNGTPALTSYRRVILQSPAR